MRAMRNIYRRCEARGAMLLHDGALCARYTLRRYVYELRLQQRMICAPPMLARRAIITGYVDVAAREVLQPRARDCRL